MSGPGKPRAAIVGLRGTAIRPEEWELFQRLPPAGFILFGRNCAEPSQVASLTAELRAIFPGRRLPVLIDQEGGRVMRLRPPHWPALPPAARIGAMSGPDAAIRAAARLGRAIGDELRVLGIDVDCAPCMDVRRPETTAAIGDRAFAADGEMVGRLGRAMAEGLLEAGVVPVMKHLPGHGRAVVDSHELLPVVEADLRELESVDLVPFRRNADLPMAMTAHVVFTAVDPETPATLSAKVIRQVIRGAIGFRGVLLTDDLGMKALGGSFSERTARARDAGCDIALHCSGDVAEAEEVLDAAGEIEDSVARQLAAALAEADRADPAGRGSALAQLNEMLAVA